MDLSGFWRLNFAMLNSGLTPNDCIKQRHLFETTNIGPIIHQISETVQHRTYVTVIRTKKVEYWLSIGTNIDDLE